MQPAKKVDVMGFTMMWKCLNLNTYNFIAGLFDHSKLSENELSLKSTQNSHLSLVINCDKMKLKIVVEIVYSVYQP